MNTEMKHTPTPWNEGGSIISDIYGNEIARVSTYGAGIIPAGYVCPWHAWKDNAAFITLACNSYHSDQAKIKALTEALQAVSRRHPGTGGIGDIARAALSLAKS